MFGVDLNGHRLVSRSIEHGRNQARGAYTARGILVELPRYGAWLLRLQAFFSLVSEKLVHSSQFTVHSQNLSTAITAPGFC